MRSRRALSRRTRSERSDAITVRRATPADAGALMRLALLDSRPLPPGPILVAEVAGEIVAALPVAGAPAIADPFRPTAAIVELLALRARQLRAAERAEPARLETPVRRAGTVLALGRR